MIVSEKYQPITYYSKSVSDLTFVSEGMRNQKEVIKRFYFNQIQMPHVIVSFENNITNEQSLCVKKY